MILRRATADDAGAIARLHLHTLRTSLPFLPELHTEADAVGYFGSQVLPTQEVWVAEEASEVVGFIAFAPGWIHHLYVDPRAQGQGIGRALLAQALADGEPRQLWTFQKNTRARAFYEAHGFALVELTDGAGNEEREPDARYVWRGL